MALAVKPSLAISAVLVGAFALLHGHAHGTELPSIPRTALRSIAERDPFAVLGIDSPAARAVRSSGASAEGDLSRDAR